MVYFFLIGVILSYLYYLQYLLLLYTCTPLHFGGKYFTFTPLHLFDNFSYF